MNRHLIPFLLFFILLSCKQKQNADIVVETPVDSVAPPVHRNCNAMYYWKTTFRLSADERDFLAAHNVERLYLRMFDVYRDPDSQDKVVPVPEATVRFIDTVPGDLEIIPTVFIDNQLFKCCDMNTCVNQLAGRIETMIETHDLLRVHEVQLDCDWTATTEQAYFEFLEAVGRQLAQASIELSATIRLHQLTMKAPPVKRGVLMCYNTGGVRNPQTDNSILSANDVAAYAKNLSKYQLPLDVAYPTFSWAVWFKKGKFQTLLRNLSPEDINIKQLKNNRFTVTDGFYQEGKYLAPGDEIRFETSDFNEIIRSKATIEKDLTDYSVVLYHLDYNNLSKYTEDEINQIFAR
jgi:hypothetical protein